MTPALLHYSHCPAHLGGAEDSVTCSLCNDLDARANMRRAAAIEAVKATLADPAVREYAEAVAGGGR